MKEPIDEIYIVSVNKKIFVSIDCVLKIIEGFVESRFYPDGGTDYYIEDVEGLEDAIESLKGGEAE